jgi:flagellar protein FlaG
MNSTAPISGITPDPSLAPSATATASTGSETSQAKSTQAGADADLRLVIEDDKATGSYVYVTINPVTHEVVAQVPREQLLKMREDPNYTPGSFINSVS